MGDPASARIKDYLCAAFVVVFLALGAAASAMSLFAVFRLAPIALVQSLVIVLISYWFMMGAR